MTLGGTRARSCAKPPEKNIERQSTWQDTRWHHRALTVPKSRVPAALAPATTRRPGGHSGGGWQADMGGSCSPRRRGAWGGLGCCVVATGRAAAGALSDPTLLAHASFPPFQVTSAHMPVARHVRRSQSGSGPTPGRWARLWALRHPLGASVPMAGPCGFPWALCTCAPLRELCPPLGVPPPAGRAVSRQVCDLPPGVPYPAGRAVSRWCSVCRWPYRPPVAVPSPAGAPSPAGRALSRRACHLPPGVPPPAGRATSRRACRLPLGVPSPAGRAVSRAPSRCRPVTCAPSRQTFAHG